MPNYSGIWTLPTQYQAQAAGNWPEVVTPIFNEANIMLPVFISANRVTFYRYNWITDTVTNVANNISFFASNNNGVNVVQDPSGNYYFNGGAGTSGSAYTLAYLPTGSDTFTYTTYNTGNYPDYGDQYSGMTWNPVTSKVNYCVYPYYAEASSYSAILSYTGSTNTVATVGSSTYGPFGNVPNASDMALLVSQDRNGKNTLGTTIVGAGQIVRNSGSAYIMKCTTSSVTFNTTAATLTSNVNCTIAPLSTTTAIVTNNGSAYYFDGTTATAITSSVIAGAYYCVYAGSGMYMILANSSGNGAAVYRGVPTPTWSTTLTTELNLATRNTMFAWGAGDVFYVVTRNTSTNQLYISKLTFNITSGTYIAVHRTLTGVTSSANMSYKRWRSYQTS